MPAKLVRKINRKLKSILSNSSTSSPAGKFVVITRSRTGSNLLISLLDSHDDIVAFGEKFNRLEGRSCQSVYDEIFRNKPNKQVGFKIFYYHPLDSEDKSIWDLIQNDPHIKIIHLIRENLLRVHISRLIAGKTDVWSSKNKKDINPDSKKVEINPTELLNDIRVTHNHIKAARETFNQHSILEVTYEDLIDPSREVLNDIQKFLDVAPKNLASELRRQNPEALSQLISNYQEIHDLLAGTDYEFMLED